MANISHSHQNNLLKIIDPRRETVWLTLVEQLKREYYRDTPTKRQFNEKRRLAEPPLRRLDPVSSYQTKKTVSVDIPPHIAL